MATALAPLACAVPAVAHSVSHGLASTRHGAEPPTSTDWAWASGAMAPIPNATASDSPCSRCECPWRSSMTFPGELEVANSDATTNCPNALFHTLR